MKEPDNRRENLHGGMDHFLWKLQERSWAWKKWVRKTQDRIAAQERLRWGALALACLLSGLWLTLIAFLLEEQSLMAALALVFSLRFWYTVVFLAAFVAFLGLLLQSLLWGGIITSLPVVLLGLVNYYKVALTGTPLALTDLSLADRVVDIAVLNLKSLRATPSCVLAVCLVVLLWIVLGLFSRPLVGTKENRRKNALASLAPLALLPLVFWVGLDLLVLTPLGAPGWNPLMEQGEANARCGVTLGFWRGGWMAAHRAERTGMVDWENYFEHASGDDETGDLPEGTVRPNVILILSESFFDVTDLPGVEFEEDPLARFHALQDEGVSGTFYTRTLGYGTFDIELELLTGINTAFVERKELHELDPQLLGRVPGVPEVLRRQGYRTVMLHLFDDSIYHRKNSAGILGFEETYFSEDMAGIDPEAAAADEEYWDYLDEKITGGYYSDDYLTQLLIRLSQERKSVEDPPLFAFGISMENHAPHYGDKYTEEEYTIQPISSLTGEAGGALNAVCQGAHNASEALGKLTDYFRTQETPTVIVFFGDHRPGLGVGDAYDSVYASLGLCEDSRFWLWNAEQRQALFSTSYLIWSNDPDYLPAPAGTRRDDSCNYLGLSVLNAARVGLPKYWRILENISQYRVVDTYASSLDRQGNYTLEPRRERQEGQELLDLMTSVWWDVLKEEEEANWELLW